MEYFERSWQEAHTYPSCLCNSDDSALILDGYRHELCRQAPNLFCNETSASVDFLDAYNSAQGFKYTCVRNNDDLTKTLRIPTMQRRPDPLCRFVFLYAPTSRDPLNTTLEMAQHILSYHQVMPLFIDCLLAFGFREHSQDCTLTDFCSNNRLTDSQRGLVVAELGRSGRLMEHCYSLRTVERSNGHLDWPWAIRQCSVYHSLDLESAQATWIVVKANRLIEKLVADIFSSPEYRSRMEPGSVAAAVEAALAIHELVAGWSGDNWNWYITFLEESLQSHTRRTLAATMEPEKSVPILRQFPEVPFAASPTQTSFEAEETFEKPSVLKRVSTTFRSLSTYKPNVKLRRTKVMDSQDRYMSITGHKFSFKDLPQVHYLEEKANEALDILQNNDEVLECLKTDYQDVMSTLGLDDHASNVIARFERHVTTVQKKLRLQRKRVGKLLRLLADRKALLQSILSYESMEANRQLAEKASISADNTELIARSTRLETVSMRIITVVTLFFLPGTFISTLMSTPIVTFEDGSSSIADRNISAGALSFYAAVSVPLMLFTFGCWYGVYWWESRKDRRKQHRRIQLPEEP